MAETTTNLQLTTELEAVNTLLRCVSEAPIADVDDPQSLSAMNALKTLRRVSREIQTRGWWFNHEYDVTLSVDQDSKIPIGANVLEVDTYSGDKWRNVVQRGLFLYDMDENTFVFDGDVKVERIIFLSFEDLPESARNYIVIKAGREFQSTELGDSVVTFGFKEADEIQALMLLKNQEGRNAGHNILTGSFGTASIIDRTGLYGDLITRNTIGR